MRNATGDTGHQTSRTPRASAFDPGGRLRLAAMLALAALLVAAFGVLGHGARAQGAAGTVEPPAAGLFFRPGAGEAVYAAPALSSDVVVDVAGEIARVTVRQHFRNPTDAWLEGVYVFPLPDRSAVDRLTMKIGERTVEGRILEREEAEAVYRRAAQEGRHASLLTSARPNVFSTAVANIGPGQEITIEIGYQDRTEFRDGRWQYRFPMAVAPRYTPDAAPKLVAVPPRIEAPWPRRRDIAQRDEETTRKEPGRDLLGPVRRPEDGPANTVSLAVLLDAGVALADIVSPGHAIDVTREGDARAVVTLGEGVVPADRDFVLEWTPAAAAAPQVGLFAEEVHGATHLAVNLLPPAESEWPGSERPRDLLLILDKSGSMSGPAMEQAKQAVALAIRRLGPGDRFDLIAFDDQAARLFGRLRRVDDASRAEALRALDRLEADGGTEMSGALDLAFDEGADGDVPDDSRLRQIVFVTDGAVSNERELFDMIAARLGEARLFTVGIGSAPNGFFMRRAAEAGRGTYTFIDGPTRVDDEMTALLRKLERPALTDIELHWDVDAARRPEVHPARIPDLYMGEPVAFAVRLPGRPLDTLDGTLSLSGRIDGRPWSASLDLAQAEPARGVAAIWARAEIDELLAPRADADARPEEIRFRVVKTATAYGLVTRYTSLVAVDDQAVARPEGEDMTQTEIARDLPAGMDYDKVFGEAAGKAQGFTRISAEAVPPGVFAETVALPSTATPAPRMALIGGAAALGAIVLVLLARRRRVR